MCSSGEVIAANHRDWLAFVLEYDCVVHELATTHTHTHSKAALAIYMYIYIKKTEHIVARPAMIDFGHFHCLRIPFKNSVWVHWSLNVFNWRKTQSSTLFGLQLSPLSLDSLWALKHCIQLHTDASILFPARACAFDMQANLAASGCRHTHTHTHTHTLSHTNCEIWRLAPAQIICKMVWIIKDNTLRNTDVVCPIVWTHALSPRRRVFVNARSCTSVPCVGVYIVWQRK